MNFNKEHELDNANLSSINYDNIHANEKDGAYFEDNSLQAIETRELQDFISNTPEVLEGVKYQESIQQVVGDNQENIKTASRIQGILEESKEASLKDLKKAMVKSKETDLAKEEITDEEYSWCINKKTGEYEWVSCDKKLPYHIDVGAYKVIYDDTCRTIYVYYKNDPEPVEELYMTMVEKEDEKGNIYKHYNDDRAAKFSMICAELGGSILKEDNPLNEALIISASMDNRLLSEELEPKFKEKEVFTDENLREQHGDGSYQSLFKESQYNAVTAKSYQDFEYGLNKRTSNVAAQKVGLATVYNAMDNPVSKLQSLGLEDAPEVLGYAHSGNPSLFKNKEIDFSSLKTHNMSRVVGSEYYGKDLEEYHQKNNIEIYKNGTMEDYQYPTY